ncbi:MAG: GIY-YIG nuclease family protein [Candidatus Cloacimonetes bacterium]|nr:GIY-YIG nuclease family protein [Candidatus Cloacimonadota bacterium]MBL7149445.1 GIY-YIG nuclease family protein [Candidatus Cloacimonadota bacterium]
MDFTYILYSKSKDNYYVGHTHDLKLRLERHNSGWSRSTKSGIPWQLVYYEEYETKSEAIKREYEIKRKKSRRYIETMISK